jgi:hypothetical protein
MRPCAGLCHTIINQVNLCSFRRLGIAVCEDNFEPNGMAAVGCGLARPIPLLSIHRYQVVLFAWCHRVHI